MAAVLRNSARLVLVLSVTALVAIAAQARAETVARCGAGWLELIDGYRVLHLKGTPYEMGYQHGALLKEHCRQNLDYLLNVKGGEKVEIGPLKVSPRVAIEGIVAGQKKYVPKKYFEEMDGLAAAAQLQPKDVYAANFIPELFHCSGFALLKSATKDGTLYHGRVLDYSIDWRLQEHAVLIVAEPTGGIPFVNVTYAGFVGSVTGMNAAHVSIGEMGGRGLGHWQGEPMAFLVRDVLESAADLDAAVALFRDNPRTCEYYYVIADGKSNRAVGMAATWEKLDVIQPGQADPRLPHAVPDAVLMSAGDRYEELVRRVQQSFGQFDAERAIRLMDRPVAMKSNLHDALFAPASTRLWVANASKDCHPASEQKYYAFQLTDLLARTPEVNSQTIPMPASKAASRSDKAVPVALR
jgi:isopenicillin-N N-acyltransferase like protein